MGRSRNQHGSLYMTTSKRSGLSSWWGKYRLYDKRGKISTERSRLGFTHEISEKDARIKLAALVERMNKKFSTIHEMTSEEILKHELDFSANPSRRLTGAISELIVAADLLTKGYEVFRAVCGTASCDLIALKGGEFQRIEVKTGRTGTMTDLRRNMGKFDIAAIFCKDSGSIIYKNAFELPSLKSSELSASFGTNGSSDVDENKAC